MRKRSLKCNHTNVCHNDERYRLVSKHKLHKTLWQDDYVINHYRPPAMTRKMCAKSLLRFHLPHFSAFHINNETINIWSHLLGFIYFTYQQYYTNYIVLLSVGSHKADHFVFTLSIFGMQMCSRVGLLHIIYCIIITFGICPTVHWVFLHGGFDSDHVVKWFPNVIVLYSLIAAAFMFYVTMVPERLWPGKFDVVGCSHQWWHIFILGAMIYWQQSGNQLLTEYRSFSDSCHRFIPQQNFSEISHSISNYSHPSIFFSIANARRIHVIVKKTNGWHDSATIQSVDYEKLGRKSWDELTEVEKYLLETEHALRGFNSDSVSKEYDYQERKYDEINNDSDEKENDEATDSDEDSSEDSDEDKSTETDESLPEEEDTLQEPSETSHHYNDRRRIGGRAARVWNARQYQYYHLSVHYLINVYVKLRSKIDI
ncbi:hypothetical protein GCK72_012989 [Caenorhabditis remanei]|uniref:Progestin and adipoQ receptor family member 3 n=1 Tax=Caenorhabditis remanei TaxID=31234 RepID=A0A6A5GPT7_CAERE|nr:hypothetical protein GCK72_012989 [Caenorhabditis remanei]KAF1756536.1 hypothetical protein GCK72_012989 [Caenorhabditis remanei]